MKRKMLFIASILVAMVILPVNAKAAEYTLTVVGGYIDSAGNVSTGNRTTTTMQVEEGARVFVDSELIIDGMGDPTASYYFDHWSSSVPIALMDDITYPIASFTMPSSNVTLTGNNVAKSSYEIIPESDLAGVNSDYSNLDSAVQYTINLVAPEIGTTISSTNNGTATSSDGLTLLDLDYYDLDDTEHKATKLEYGKKYMVVIAFQVKSTQSLDEGAHLVKVTGTEIYDTSFETLGHGDIKGYVFAGARTNIELDGDGNYNYTSYPVSVGKYLVMSAIYTPVKPTTTITNPKTFDGISNYLMLGTISSMAIAALYVTRKKISCK